MLVSRLILILTDPAIWMGGSGRRIRLMLYGTIRLRFLTVALERVCYE